MNILFICSKNKWRSRTAEAIFRNSQEHEVRSAGTDEDARIRLTEKHISWADIIFVMETKHREKIQQKFSGKISDKKIIVLDIPDEYQYIDEELISILKTSTAPYISG